MKTPAAGVRQVPVIVLCGANPMCMAPSTHYVRFTLGRESSHPIASCAHHVNDCKRAAGRHSIGVVVEAIEESGNA
jgi:hypothetical protein